MELEIKEKGFDREKVDGSIRDIIGSNRLLSMATVNEKSPQINTAFYSFSQELEIYILTPPETEHGKNLEDNSSVAIDIHSSDQEWTDEKQGLQIQGEAEKVEDRERVIGNYIERFPAMREVASTKEELEELDSVFYRITPEKIKVFDEPRFGTETWIEVEIVR